MFAKPIVIPWDFSECSKRALEFAAEAGTTRDFRVLCVLEEPNPYEPGVVWGTVSEDIAREKCEQSFFEEIDKSEYPELEFHIVFGDPATEIVKFAREIDAGVILISSHGRSGFKRLLLGSVAEKVARTASQPVMLLPNAWFDANRDDVDSADNTVTESSAAG